MRVAPPRSRHLTPHLRCGSGANPSAGHAADSPRAVQLDSGLVGIVFMNKEGVHYLEAALADLV